jgi:SAM-dependent methyltransferase
VAESYDRVRPDPSAEALDWLVPAGCEVAVDLAAGTGLFTRALLGRVADVVAVEPDARMRAVLAQQSPQVRVLEGRGEEMPLPDGCADAVFVSTAWHWLDPAQAVPEIARVLRPGGRLGVVWTSRDRQQDWVAGLDLLRMPFSSGGPDATRAPRTVDEVRARLEREHTVTLPDGAEFGAVETASFGYTRTLPVADAVEWLASNSSFITAPPDLRAAGLERFRAALLKRTGGASVIEMPVRSWCWRAERAGLRLPKARSPAKRFVTGLRGRHKPYHLHVATEYGGAYGGQPWQRAVPPYRGQPPQAARRVRTRWIAAIAALVLGVAGLAVSLTGVVSQALPREFTAQQQRQITDWEAAERWRDLPAGEVFPAAVSYSGPSALTDDPGLRLSANRVGIARQASCAAATDAAVAAVLDRDGCAAMLRATYVDGTDSYVVTVGVAVMPGSAQATAAAPALARVVGASGEGVRTLPVGGTLAAAFTDTRRQLSGSAAAGPYLIFYTVGYTDDRPRLQVTADSYTDAEMTNAGQGIAGAVGSVLDGHLRPPRCPGTPGC